MDKKADIPEIYADANICAALHSYFQANNINELCNINIVDRDNITLRYQGQEKTYITPVRLGEILDRIACYRNMENNNLISFDGGTLDIHQGVFRNKSNEQIYLTEKEVAILLLLHENKGRVIARAELLRDVWNYADDAQTHTLETHIYRLRQKIEIDPANPQILMTKDNGYSV